MLKVFAVLFFLPSLLLFFVSDKPKNVRNNFISPSPTKTPVKESQSGVENLILEEEFVNIWCPTSSKSGQCSKEALNVKVKTFSKDAEKNNLNYYYVVSGGQIIGQGADVIWSFSGVGKPGKYTITAGIGSDNIFHGKTITKTIELGECPACTVPCECPAIEITGPTKSIEAGKSFIVKADIKGGSQSSIYYIWGTTGGTIVGERNSSQVIVKTDSNDKNKKITVTVELVGICETCTTDASETFVIK